MNTKTNRIKSSKRIWDDYKVKITKQFISDLAEGHLECWKSRYEGKLKRDVRFDLNVNYDISLEIESVEELLGRKLGDAERSDLEIRFIKEVVKQYKVK